MSRNSVPEAWNKSLQRHPHANLKQTRLRISWTCCKYLPLSSLLRKMLGVWGRSWTIQTVSWWLLVTEKMLETRCANQVSLSPVQRFPNPFGVLLDHVWLRPCLQNIFVSFHLLKLEEVWRVFSVRFATLYGCKFRNNAPKKCVLFVHWQRWWRSIKCNVLVWAVELVTHIHRNK